MRIKRLELKDFRNHELSTLELDEPFVVVKGKNFSGKSSIAQAISMCLTPSTIGLDATGRGFTAKIRRGQPKAVITADIQGGKHVVQNAVTLNTNTTGRTSRATCLDAPDWHPGPFERIMENNRAALSVALNTDAFLLMDEKSQKSLLAKLALPAKYDFPADKIKAVEAAIGEGAVSFASEPFAVIEQTYKLLYKERELTNRQVKDFIIPETLGVVEGLNSTDLQRKLDYAKETRQKVATERNDAIKLANDAEVKRARLSAKIEQLETAVREAQGQSKTATQRMVADAKLKDLRKTAESKAALDALETERHWIRSQIEQRQAEIQQYSATAEIGSECPTCGQPIAKDSIANLVGVAAKAQSELRQKDKEVLDKMKALGDVDGAIKAITDHEVAVSQRNTLEALIAEKMKQLTDAGNEMRKLPQEPTNTAGLEQAICEADEAVNRLTMSLRPVIAAEEREKEIQTKTEQLDRLKEKASSLNELVSYFGKDGLKATLLAEHIGGFEDKINSILAAWSYKVSLAIEPDFQFLVTDARGVTTPFRELSGSESLFFLVALQCAVSRTAGIGIVVADKLDTFLPEQRKKANACLYKAVMDGTLEQAILIMSDEGTEAPKLPHSAFFLVTDGTVQRL